MSAAVRYAGASALALALAFVTSLPVPAEEKKPAPLQVGISRSVFFEQPEWRIEAATAMWTALVKNQTGIQAEFKPVDTDRLGQLLARQELDMAVFQGYELAWAAQKDPQLRPLVIIVNEKPYLHAAYLVRQDAKAKKIADLQGQTAAIHQGRRSHVRLYFERSCTALGKEPKDFFGKIAVLPNSEDALDDVVDGVVQAAVVDTTSLDAYQRRKPGRFRFLKELAQSSVFPDPVIGYRAGALDDKTLERFRDGMIKSDQSLRGRQMLTFFKLTHFAKVPEDYERVQQEIAKAYPPATEEPRPVPQK